MRTESAAAEQSDPPRRAASPATDATYRWAPISHEDVAEWCELSNVLAATDGTGEFNVVDDLAEELSETGVHPDRDLLAVWSGPTMVGYGQLRVAFAPDGEGRARIWVSGGVHPDYRGRGLGRSIMDQMEARGRDLATERQPRHPAYLRVDGGVEGASVRALLEHRGYRPVRYFHLMSRPLPGQQLVVSAAGVQLTSPAPAQEEPVRVAHNRAFADHWGSTPQTPQIWADHWHARASRLGLSTVALDPAGEVVSYVLCGQWVPRELYVAIVGTVPEARGRGLARAALARTMRAAAATGDFDRADLHVDSASPTGATRLYDSLGFRVKSTSASYQRDLPRT